MDEINQEKLTKIKDKNNKCQNIINITPLEFFNKYVQINLDQYYNIINYPSPNKTLNKTFI